MSGSWQGSFWIGFSGVGFICFGIGRCWVARCSLTHHCLLLLTNVFMVQAFPIMQGSEFCSQLPMILQRLCPSTKAILCVGVRCQLSWGQRGSGKEYVDEHKCLVWGLDVLLSHTSKILVCVGVFLGRVSERKKPMRMVGVHYSLCRL